MSLEYKIFCSDYQAQDVNKVNAGDSVQEAGEDGKGIENVIPVEAKEVRGMLQRLQWTGGISSLKNLYFQKIFFGTLLYFLVLYGTFWYFIVLYSTFQNIAFSPLHQWPAVSSMEHWHSSSSQSFSRCFC